MNAATQSFEAVESYQPTEPENARRSRAVTVIIVIAAVLLTAAVVLVVGQLLYGTSAATVEASPAPVATSPEPTEQQQVDEVPAVTEPTAPEPAEAPAAPPVNDGHEGPSSDPVEPPASEPTTYTHPLAGTLWDVVVLSDGVGGMYDIHPAYPHQIEFDDSHVYTRGFVNGGSAEYAITGNEYGWGNSFTTGPLMTTLMLGPADAMMQEGWINGALGNAASYEIDEYTLYIKGGSGETLLILEVVPGC